MTPIWKSFNRWAWIGLACSALPAGVLAQPRTSSPPSAAAGDRQSARNSVQKVEYAILSSGRTLIRLQFRSELTEKPTVVVGYHPAAYISLDFLDTVNESAKEVVEGGQRELRSLQLVRAGNRLRLLIRLGRPVPHEIEIKGNELLITLHRPVS